VEAPFRNRREGSDEIFMNIAFYGNHFYYGGLANNGGSRTILLSAEELRKLGHRVDVVTHTDRFTWFKHPKVIRKIAKDTDCLVAISISDVGIMTKAAPKGCKLFYWARPMEFWQKSERKCLKKLKNFPGKIMCNSRWQVNWLNEHGIKAEVFFSGQDLEDKVPKRQHANKFPIVGVQYSTKPRKGWGNFKRIVDILGTSVRYVGFGSEKCKENIFSIYLRNPGRDELTDLYRRMSVFVCCSDLEGFYNPGVEAAMQGCVIVANNNSRNGCMDYCTPETAHIHLSPVTAAENILNPDFTKVDKMRDIIKTKIGTRKQNMERMIECLK